MPVSPWNLQAVHIHLAAGLPNVKWIEYFMPDNPLLERLKFLAIFDGNLDEFFMKRVGGLRKQLASNVRELSPDNRWLVATDEDFNPYRVVAEITSGPHSGTEFTAISGSGVPPIGSDTDISGTPTFVGLASYSLSAIAYAEMPGRRSAKAQAAPLRHMRQRAATWNECSLRVI